MGVRPIAVAICLLFTTTARAEELARDTVLGSADTIRGGEAPGLVAFTFDDGPRPGTTDKVIDALLEYDVPATFFVVGKRLKGKRAQPARDLVAKMIEHGFEVGNHSFSHPNLKALNARKNAWQLDETSKLIAAATGKSVGLFRAPFGAVGKATAAHAASRGLTIVDWSIDSLDWKKPKEARMRKAIVDGIFRENGGVVLMHDTKKLTAKSIRQILDDLEAGNCARLAAGEAAIVPVSIHYFLRDDDQPRTIPPEVEARTQRYRDALPARCDARAREQAPEQQVATP
jgi:peptidoglycan/xylan/chitin deacetylase (PgdA/CDA1 family)